jgi:hypothetical protein
MNKITTKKTYKKCYYHSRFLNMYIIEEYSRANCIKLWDRFNSIMKIKVKELFKDHILEAYIRRLNECTVL